MLTRVSARRTQNQSLAVNRIHPVTFLKLLIVECGDTIRKLTSILEEEKSSMFI